MIRNIGWGGAAFIFFFSLINYFVRYVRWYWYLKLTGENTPFIDGLLCYLSGFALTTTPGKAGEALRCLYYKQRHDVAHSHTLAALITERATDAIAGIVLSLAVLYHFENFRFLVWLVLGVFAIMLVLIRQKQWLLMISDLMARHIRISALQHLLQGIPNLIHRTSELFSFKAIAGGILIGLIGWGAEAYAFAWMVQTTGLTSVSVFFLMGIFTLSMVAGGVSFLPGGLGSTELAMGLMLGAIGLAASQGAALTVFCRFATLWFAVVLGLFAWLWLSRQFHSFEKTGQTGTAPIDENTGNTDS